MKRKNSSQPPGMISPMNSVCEESIWYWCIVPYQSILVKNSNGWGMRKDTYRRHTGEVTRGKRTSFIVGPDINLPFETEEDVVRFFVEMKPDGLIECAARSYDCESIICLLACHEEA
jgi:hypothetical protein